ncbi:ABC transporter ATP-binding protein [Plantibacter sp. Mn2098]|uniref:ABC transporter ATP-binding protein n=1 Tax=Plantibacter sp. Mn2098 TaxID=3395266 RepID=UPI003BCDBFF2
MIRLDGVTFSYDPGVAPNVVAGIDLDIGEDEFLGIVGRNGSGKSSLARTLNGLNLPTAGQVTVDGHPTNDPASLVEVRRRVQMVFQNPENQQVGVTVFEDVAFGLSNMGVPGPEMPSRAIDALGIVGLDVALDRDVNTLSGGQLQRLALASVLALQPAYLILDEATAMLDPGARRDFLRSLAETRRRRPFAVVAITHHLEEVEDADRIVVVHEGRIEAQGRPGEVLSEVELLGRCGLEPLRRRITPRSGAARRTSAAALVPAPETTQLEARDVTVFHGGRRAARSGAAPALAGLSVAVGRGELVAVAGKSGAGKSTLIATLKGLLRPVSGSIAIEGLDPWATKHPESFDAIGYIFQFSEHQLFAATVRDDVAYGLRSARLSAEDVAARVDAALVRVGLDPERFGPRSPFELSGGEKRRVALAGVLVTEPRVLILDEPTAGLDHPSRRQVFELMHDLNERGITVLWVSHKLEDIYEHADRVVVIDQGRIVADGGPGLVTDRTILDGLGWPEPEIGSDADRELFEDLA